jgi:cytochrome c peroxidase
LLGALAWAQGARAQNIIRNGAASGPPGAIVPGFLFEPEVPMASLKAVPTWNELEQLLDDPYDVRLCSSLPASVPALIRNTPAAGNGVFPGNTPDFPSYCTTAGFQRRPSFGVTLPPLILDPLNYNPTTGEEMRVMNRLYLGGPFDATGACQSPDANPCTPEQRLIQVTPGLARLPIAEGETQIDYNSPFARDSPICILSAEIPEGVALCGGDPGEPGYTGFGVLDLLRGYSTPALPLRRATPATPIPASARLLDPLRPDTRDGLGVIRPRNSGGGEGGLRKPSLRIAAVGGRANQPNFLVNSAADLAADPTALAPSNENDYLNPSRTRGVPARTRAMQLGKALFWDMQVGSDGIQSCGSCHAHAGADNRTKNQLNPNHLGPEAFAATIDLRGPGTGANVELRREDFPLHKLTNPSVAGDPACTTPVTASINPGVLENNFPGGVTGHVVCDAANVRSDTNDVVSSMGVHYGRFKDIPAPGAGAFSAPSTVGGVRALLPDLRMTAADAVPDFLDPLADFAGATGNEFRRVEPRNTPTIFLADVNFDNFWDGRARHDFNGGSVFGAADPQAHVWVNDGGERGDLVATRQLIRFSSLASLATGPALSEFEMSFQGRNWPKIGKKLLQGTAEPSSSSVTPLANQLVSPQDSVLGPWSNQGGSECVALGRATLPGKPGLCTTYRELVQLAFHPRLWNNTRQHLDGCYDDPVHHPAGPLCPPGVNDPFDGYVLSPAARAARAAMTNEFRQQEANFSLFFGLSVHLWATILVPDDTPLDQFLDLNPDAFASLGESGEPGLVADLPVCTTPTERWCFREVGLFKRDANVPDVNGRAGTRTPGSNEPDPLLGLDVFEGSNLSLKNPNFRSARCGECHAMPTLTDHTVMFTHKAQLRDFVGEFIAPGVESTIEPLGRLRLISGFLLESEMNENGQDGVERRIINQSIVPNPSDGLAYPDGIFNPDGTAGTVGTVLGDDRFTGAGQAFFDNGVYNIGVRPIAEDIGRGGNDAFGWPLSLAALLLKDLGGPAQEPSTVSWDPMDPSPAERPLATFACEGAPCDEIADATGGLFEETLQDQGINPGEEGEPVNPLLPPHLSPWANQINVGDSSPGLDEVFGGLNTLTDTPMLEGFGDTIGPFNPAGVLPEELNSTLDALMGTWPVVNRVGRMGSFKAPQLREVELTGPYFHNGGKLTLRQVVDFYTRGGDFPVSNAAHRDFNIVNLDLEVQSNLTEAEKVALVDFLLTLTDDRVRFERAPFDHPQVIIPLDGRAPENGTGRDALLVGCTDLAPSQGRQCLPDATSTFMFRDVPAVGAGGNPATAPLPSFLDVSRERLSGDAAFCATAHSHYCH